MNMLNEKLVERAINLARPQIEAIFQDPIFVWGPKLVAITVVGPGLTGVNVAIVGDRNQDWDPEWSRPERFLEIALWKAEMACKHGVPTAQLADVYPLLLQEKDFFYPGGVPDASGKIGIGTSGIKGRGDEAISYIVLALMNALAHRRVEQLREEGKSQL